MAVVGDMEMTLEEFRLLSDFICESSGMCYSASKLRVLERRLKPLAISSGCSSFRDFYYALRFEGNGYVEQAIDAVVNNETYFFREAAQLRGIADLAEARVEAGPMRILSAGCSTGEEPYSLAMLLQDRPSLAPAATELVAVDVSSRVLRRARIGRYGAGSFRSQDGQYYDWHFSPAEDSTLELAKHIRDRVKLAHANLLHRDQMLELGSFDAILCRNVLIYFKLEGRRAVVDTFRDMLVPGGHLFLGHSESLNGVSDDFELVRISEALAYRKPGDVR